MWTILLELSSVIGFWGSIQKTSSFHLSCCTLMDQSSLEMAFLIPIFTRDGIFNTQNTHTWAAKNPHAVTHRSHQERFSINVWTSIIGDIIIGSVLLLDRLTGEAYRCLLEDTLPLLLEDVPIGIRLWMWFQHDGAPAHFLRITRKYLDLVFPGCGGPVSWPPWSLDIRPLDFYLWGHIKSKVYETEVPSREEIWRRVQESVTSIHNNPGFLERVRQSLQRRAEASIVHEGGRNSEHLL